MDLAACVLHSRVTRLGGERRNVLFLGDCEWRRWLYWAGFLADRLGRTTVAIGAMWISGACALLAGPAAHVSFSFFVLVCLLWGVSISADSAQFSACVTELSAPDEVGTALTLQNCLGFLLTMLSIRLVPPLQEYGGWTLAFVVLAIGPLLGSFAMLQLRRSPVARVALAGGKG
jgi:MFS family permease